MAAVQEEDCLAAAEAGLVAGTTNAQQKTSIRDALQSPSAPMDPDDVSITVISSPQGHVFGVLFLLQASTLQFNDK